MARRNIRRSFVGGRAQRRLTEWQGYTAGLTDAVNLAAATSQLDSSTTEATLASVVPATIVRVWGELWIKSDQLAATENPYGAYGMAVVSEQARALGVTALPAAMADSGSDLWFVQGLWHAGVSVSTVAGTEQLWSRYSFDSRAMRKISDGEGIVFMIENQHATHGARYQLFYRTLFKLH